jgi:suppressor of ftsI
MRRSQRKSGTIPKCGSGLLAALVFALTGMGLGVPRSALAQSGPLTEPLALHSVNGVLDTTLILDEGPAQIAGQTVNGVWTFRVGEDGAPNYPGPTLYVNRGDTIKIHYVSHLDTEPTSLHTHGLHVSPVGNSDNVLLDIPPGASNDFVIEIPANQPEGLYWYHPHRHGSVDDQVYHGLAGLIVIGRPDSSPTELNGVQQRLLALQYSYVENGVLTEPLHPPASTFFTVNGQLNPRIDIRPGETQVWNLANISNNAGFKVVIKGTEGAADPPYYIVAQDGDPYMAPVAYSPGQSLLIPAGARFSVLIQGPAAGTYQLGMAPYDDGFNTWPPVPTTLATIVSAGAPVTPMPIPTHLTPPVNDFEPLDQEPVDTHRTALFSIQDNPDGPPVFQINHGAFPDNPVFLPRLNTVEEWELLNDSADDHPFHIHVNDFQVISYTDPNHPEDNITTPQPWFQDIILLPKAKFMPDGTMIEGRAVIRMKALDFLGGYVFHCHRVDHEDLGMMAQVTIIPNIPIYAIGAGQGVVPKVKVFSGVDNKPLAELNAFSSDFHGGVRVAVGDVNRDGFMDLLMVPASNGPMRVRVLSGKDGFQTELYNFLAYDARLRGGLNIASVDMNSDGFDDIIVAPATFGPPLVKIFSGKDGTLLGSFLAYEPEYRGGVRIAAGNLVDGGRNSIVTGPGRDHAPEVKVFDVDWYSQHASDPTPPGSMLLPNGKTVAIFETTSTLAYEPDFKGGVNVGTGLVAGLNGGFASVLTAPGTGRSAQVKAFALTGEGHTGMLLPGLTRPALTELASFLPYGAGLRTGVSVSGVSTVTGADLLAIPAIGEPSMFKRFSYDPTAKTFSVVDQFLVFERDFRGGVTVGGK